MTTKIKTTALVCAMVLSVGRLASATPVIKDWSSSGGRTQNKTNAKDRMYLVKPGDKITFSVKADGAEKYEWQVNKKVNAEAKGDSLVWTVPNEKGIWEIHLKITGQDKEAHQEWVISTLVKKEAPDFFDYFTDGKWKNRTETDPWARKLPEWKKNDKRPGQVEPDTSRCVLKMNGDLFNSAILYAPHKVTHGTWRCKFRVTPPISGKRQKIVRKDGRVTIKFCPLTGGRRGGGKAGIVMAAEFQGHNWAIVKLPGQESWGTCACHMPLVGGWGTSDLVSFTDDQWKDLKIIRTPDGYLRFWKATGLYGHNGYFINTLMDSSPLKPGGPDPLADSLNAGCIARSGGTKSWGEIDCIEIYKNKFISPKKISYGNYANSYIHKSPAQPPVFEYRKGILVDGFGVRLADIAQAIGKKSLFQYDSRTKTADCYTDLCIRAGAELILKGETLKMHCRTDGEHQIRVKNGATVRLERSTVTSADDHHYTWVFPSEFTPSRVYGYSYASVFTGRFIARNSTINNCGGLYFAGATEVVLEQTKLTNLVEITYPSPPHTGVIFRNWCGDSGPDHALSFRGHQVCSRLLIKGCEISAKNGKKITLRFLSMDPVVENTTIYDSILRNADVLAKKAYMFYWGYQHPTTLSLVNTQFGSLSAQTDKASILPKYYLDVKVVDGNGIPIKGAKVTVVNEVNQDHGPENAHEVVIWVPEGKRIKGREPGSQLVGRKKPQYGQPMPATITGKDGHTPLPKDARNTMILTDFVQDKSGKKEFTYTITVEKDGKKKVITGVNPGPKWYRPDPNKPACTITVVLDGKTVTEAELKKGQK